MTGLTQRQRDCLDAIGRLSVGGVSPSYQELGDALGCVSKCNIHRLVKALESRGYLRRRPHEARSLQVIRPASEDLHTTIARLSGLLAHETGETVAARMLRRIADRLEHKPRGQA